MTIWPMENTSLSPSDDLVLLDRQTCLDLCLRNLSKGWQFGPWRYSSEPIQWFGLFGQRHVLTIAFVIWAMDDNLAHGEYSSGPIQEKSLTFPLEYLIISFNSIFFLNKILLKSYLLIEKKDYLNFLFFPNKRKRVGIVLPLPRFVFSSYFPHFQTLLL